MYRAYPEIVSLSALILCNAVGWLGGVAPDFNAGFTIDLCCAPLVCTC